MSHRILIQFNIKKMGTFVMEFFFVFVENNSELIILFVFIILFLDNYFYNITKIYVEKYNRNFCLIYIKKRILFCEQFTYRNQVE